MPWRTYVSPKHEDEIVRPFFCISDINFILSSPVDFLYDFVKYVGTSSRPGVHPKWVPSELDKIKQGVYITDTERYGVSIVSSMFDRFC